MVLATDAKNISDLEQKIIRQINFCSMPRKSFEVFNRERRNPLATTAEVRQFAADSLGRNGVNVPQEILDAFLHSRRIDLRGEIDSGNINETIAWDLFWAQELAAARTVMATGGAVYERYLPGRYFHYEQLANVIDSLFNGKNNGSAYGISGKNIAEFGSGSGIGLTMLALKGANVTGLDTSVMAIEFARYIANSYAVANRTTFEKKDYFGTGHDDGKFDVVYTSGVFEHLNDDEAHRLLEEMIRTTKPGGYVAVSVPNEKSPFYRRFKSRQHATKSEYPGLVEIPVEHKRYDSDIKRLMEDAGLTIVGEDGIQVAPSSPIQEGDISKNNPYAKEDLILFARILPEPSYDVPSPLERVAYWSRLETNSTGPFRTRYGWSLYYVGQKPAELKPAA